MKAPSWRPAARFRQLKLVPADIKPRNRSRAAARGAPVELLVGRLPDLEQAVAVGRAAHHEADFAVAPIDRSDLAGDVVVQRGLGAGHAGAVERIALARGAFVHEQR